MWMCSAAHQIRRIKHFSQQKVDKVENRKVTRGRKLGGRDRTENDRSEEKESEGGKKKEWVEDKV